MAIPGEHELAQVRTLSEAEHAGIRAAGDLITKIAESAALRRLQALTQLTLDRVALVEAHDEPARHEVQAAAAGVEAMLQANEGLFTDTSLLLSDDSSNKTTVALEALEALPSSQPWTILGQLNEDGVRLVRDRSGEVGVLSENQFSPLTQIVKEAYRLSQQAYVAATASQRPRILAAGQQLRSLHVECPEGVPSLVVIPKEEASSSDSLSIVPYDLPIHLVGEALRVARVSELAAVGESAGAIPGREAVDQDEVDPADPADDAFDDAADEAESDSLRTEPGSTADDLNEAQEDQPVVNLAGLLRLAVTLNDDLARAWSGALDRALTQDAIAAQMAALRAAVWGFQRRASDERILIEEFPPSGRLLAELEADPTRAVQLTVLAELRAFVELLDGSEALTEPSIVQVKMSQAGADSLKRFWESGAFARTRGQLDLLDNLLASRDGSHRGDAPWNAFRHLRLASAAFHAGDPEACLLHSACALAAHARSPLSELEDQLSGSAIEDQEGAKAGLRTLRAILDGKPSLALAALAAAPLHDAVIRLAMPQPPSESMGAKEMFDLFAKDLPYEDVSND